MARVRVSTAVDGAMLDDARTLIGASTDAALFDQALEALLRVHRAAEFDAADDTQPLDEPDDWGDLASLQNAAARS